MKGGNQRKSVMKLAMAGSTRRGRGRTTGGRGRTKEEGSTPMVMGSGSMAERAAKEPMAGSLAIGNTCRSASKTRAEKEKPPSIALMIFGRSDGLIPKSAVAEKVDPQIRGRGRPHCGLLELVATKNELVAKKNESCAHSEYITGEVTFYGMPWVATEFQLNFGFS